MKALYIEIFLVKKRLNFAESRWTFTKLRKSDKNKIDLIEVL